MGPSADYSSSNLQDPPTPIISNQSPQNKKEMLLLDDSFDLNGSGGPIPVPGNPYQHHQNSFSDDRRTTTPQHSSPAAVVPRFSSPTEEPIIVHRSSLVQMNGQSDDNHVKMGASLSPQASADNNGSLSPYTNSTEQQQYTWNLWFRIFSDILRSDFSLDMLREALQQIFSRDGIHQNLFQLLGVPPSLQQQHRILPSPTSPTFLLSQRRKRRWQQQGRPQHISGLPNQGQTCFLNSVLQSLASLPPFLAYLDSIVRCEHEMREAGLGDTTTTTSTGPGRPSFSQQLLDLLDGVNNLAEEQEGESGRQVDQRRSLLSRSPRIALNPKLLLRMIGESSEQFQSRSYEQQDAQELLSALLGVVIAEAQLESSFDRRFVGSNMSMEEDGDLGSVTLATANAKHLKEDLNLGERVTRSIEGCSSGLSFEDEGNVLLSLSGFLSKVESDQRKKAGKTNGDLLNAISAVKPPLCLQQRQLCDQRQFQEEKKQESIDEDIISATTHTRAGDTGPRANSRHNACTSMEILKSTISTITPSPLSGWLGSTIQCTKCKHVRPIQNAPFLDIPLVPVSVPSYIGNAYHAPYPPFAPNSRSIPPCSLEDCLAEFTSVERVADVECRFCTIRREVEHFEEEEMMLRGAIQTIEKRSMRKLVNGTRVGGNEIQSSDDTKVLREDLADVEKRLQHLKTTDPDVDDFSGAIGVSASVVEDESLDLFGDDEEKVKIERCYARKCLLLTRTPSILCCHIQRRYYDPYSGNMEKCIQHVEFPDILDISPYCAYGPRANTAWAAGSSDSDLDGGDQARANGISSGRGKMPYRLQSVIEHRGNSNGGHYVSYRRDCTGHWYLISDSAVHAVSWQDVRCSQAYLLFYEAI